MLTALVLASHLFYIGSENHARKIRSYSLMVSMAYISRLPEKLSRFSVRRDDLHKIVVPSVVSVILVLATSLDRGRRNASAAYTIVCALLSAVVILGDSVGKKISRASRTLEPLPALVALVLAFATLYVCVSVKDFKMLGIFRDTAQTL